MKKKPKPPSYTRTFVIANMGDEFDSFCQRSDTYERLLYEYDLLSERGLFWSTASDLLVASQLAIPEDYIEWVARLFNKNIKVISPPDDSQPLFEYLSEPKQIEMVKEWLGPDNDLPVSLISYSATTRLKQYIHLLTDHGISLELENLPTAAFGDQRRYYSSKIGFKSMLEALAQSGHPIVNTDYYACQNLDEAYAAIMALLSSGRNAILKPNDGNSGLGSLRFYTSDLNDPHKIMLALQNDSYIQDNQIIVEEMLQTSAGGTLRSPSLEFFVPPVPQTPYPLYWSSQIISPEGNFKGVVMDHTDHSIGAIRRAESDSLAIACYLQKKGYRGNFDIDFLIREDGLYIPIEVNLRRTGGTHVYGVGMSLLREKVDNHVILSREEFGIGEVQSWEEVRSLLCDLFISREKLTGLLLVNVNMTKINRLGFIIIENSLDKALALQDEIELRLSSQLVLETRYQPVSVVANEL